MCFTLTGRLQTRFLSLIAPLDIAVLFDIVQHNHAYLMTLIIMVVVGFSLDICIYSWVLHYQPRWLTIVLGIVEFFVIQWVMTQIPLPATPLTTWQAVIFYGLAWCAAWVTTQMVLPLLWPRWAESGGQLM